MQSGRVRVVTGWIGEERCPYGKGEQRRDAECNQDIQRTKEHLLESNHLHQGSVDWSESEMEEVTIRSPPQNG